jgi:hypothetical protein
LSKQADEFSRYRVFWKSEKEDIVHVQEFFTIWDMAKYIDDLYYANTYAFIPFQYDELNDDWKVLNNKVYRRLSIHSAIENGCPIHYQLKGENVDG